MNETEETWHYLHHCPDGVHPTWIDTEVYSVCPLCGEEDIEEIPEEAWDAMDAGLDVEPEWYLEDEEDYPGEQQHNEVVE